MHHDAVARELPQGGGVGVVQRAAPITTAASRPVEPDEIAMAMQTPSAETDSEGRDTVAAA